MAATIIRSSGAVEHLDFFEGEPTLEQIRKIVGGYIEVVHIRRFGITAQIVLDEEGKLKGYPVNLLATAIAEGHISKDDYIVGDVLLLSEGNMLT